VARPAEQPAPNATLRNKIKTRLSGIGSRMEVRKRAGTAVCRLNSPARWPSSQRSGCRDDPARDGGGAGRARFGLGELASASDNFLAGLAGSGNLMLPDRLRGRKATGQSSRTPSSQDAIEY